MEVGHFAVPSLASAAGVARREATTHARTCRPTWALAPTCSRGLGRRGRSILPSSCSRRHETHDCGATGGSGWLQPLPRPGVEVADGEYRPTLVWVSPAASKLRGAGGQAPLRQAAHRDDSADRGIRRGIAQD